MANSDPSEWRLIDTDLVTVLGILPASESHLYLVLNEPGSGELKIPLGSALAGSVASGQFAQCSYRGAVRGGFFVENISKGQADAAEGGGQWVSISGRGALSLLEDAIIWDDGTTASTRDYAGMTKAAILIALIDEAQARGALANLSYDFTAVLDSDGVAWTDSENYKLNVGSSLLDITRQFARTGIDFDILPGTGDFVLSAYKLGKGSDKSETVYLRTGVNCEEVTSDEHGDKIKNTQLIAYKGGYISVSDAVSIAARRRREKLLDLKMAQTASSATTIGAAEVELRKDPQKSISVKIYDGAGPRGFVDYELGDYIMLDVQGTETRYRIYGVQPDWKGDQFSTVIVELNSILYENDIQLAQDVAWLMDQWSTADDADLLAVSYWAAIGDPNFTYNVSDFCIINDVLYMTHSTGVYSYGLTTGNWNHEIAITLPNCMVAIGTDLYIGGALVVTKYDTLTGTQTTFTVGVGLGAAVYAMAVNGTTLYASGDFTIIDGVAAAYIAQCDTTTDTWTAMADEASFLSTTPALLTMIYSNGLLYSSAGTQVQAWNGTVWANIGSAFGGNVLTFAEYGTDLLAGGQMTNGLYIWDGATWAVFGGGVNAAVRAIAVNLTDVYAAGSFTDAGNYIARYSGGSWWQLGTGLDALVDGMILYGDDVIVAGDFTTAGDKPAQGIAMYINSFESLVDYLENSSSSFNMGAAIHAAAASAVTDSDEFPFWEDVANALRKITWANIKATLKTYFDTLYVALTGAQTIAGVKTFSSDPIIPDEAYDATNWNGSLEPPTKNAVRDKIESMGGGGGTPGGSDTQIQFNDGGAFGGDANNIWDKTYASLLIGGTNWYSVAAALTGGIHVSKDGGGASTHTIIGHSWVDGTDGFTGTPSLGGDRAGGSRATPTAVLDDMGLVRIIAGGYDGTNLSGTRAQILLRAAGNWSGTSHPTKIELYTTPVGSTTRAVVLTIGSDGNVNIGSGKTFNVNGSPHTHVHNDATSLQGGTAGEYYHLTSADNTEAVAFLNGGTGTHTAMDSHIASTANPHNTTAAQVSAIPNNGWIAISATGTSGTLDAPSFEISFNADMTGLIGLGYRIKITQTTTKYFIVTKVGAYSAGATVITCYGGTDYTLIASGTTAITNPYFSPVKAPFGFPMSPDKWTVETTDTSDRQQNASTINTWYNLGSVSTSVPIGVWNQYYKVLIQLMSAGVVSLQITLSTANNSESNSLYTSQFTATAQYGALAVSSQKVLTLTAKTTHYINMRNTSGTYDIRENNSAATLISRFVCAYL